MKIQLATCCVDSDHHIMTELQEQQQQWYIEEVPEDEPELPVEDEPDLDDAAQAATAATTAGTRGQQQGIALPISLVSDRVVGSRSKQIAEQGATGCWHYSTHSCSVAPSVRGGHTMTSVPNGSTAQQVLLFGGASMEGEHYSDLWQLQGADNGKSTTATWTQLTQDQELKPTSRSGHSAVPVPQGLLVFGGADAVRDVTFDDCWLYVTQDARWVQLKCSSDGPALASHSAVLAPDGCSMVVFGGVSATGPSKAIWTLNLAGLKQQISEAQQQSSDAAQPLQWQQQQCTGEAPAAREMHAACVCAALMLVTGGRLADGTVTSDTYALDLNSWQWGKRSPCSAPRCAHTAWVLTDAAGRLLLKQYDI